MGHDEDKTDATADQPKKGAILQFLGCVLLSLGILNTLLTLKASLEPNWFNYALIGSGAVVLSMGIWRSRG